MTSEQLKASILQYAIKGKLVEQRPEDGTAEELYLQIQEEKQKLIKDGKIKKEKPLADISDDEIPFDIPDTWKWVRLGNCGIFERGNGIKKDETLEKGYPCVRYGQLYTTFKTRFSNAVSFVSKDLYDKCHKARKNDILMALTGENEYDIALAVTYEGEQEIALGGDMTRFYNHQMNPLYLTFVLNSRYGILCKSRMATGNIIVHISNDKLATIPIPLPPLNEQTRIVAKIEELLPYVNQYAVTNEKLERLSKSFPEEMKKSILQYAIQGKLVEQRPEEGTAEELYQLIQEEKQKLVKEGKIRKEKPSADITEEEIPFDIPDSWKWVRLLDLIKEKPTNGYSPKSVDYETPYRNLTLTATTSGYFKPNEYKYIEIPPEKVARYWIKNNDILIQRSNSRELVGTSCIYNLDDDQYVYPDLMMRIHVLENVDIYYLNYVLKAPLTRRYYIENATGTSDSMPKINQGIVSNTLIPLPPLSEQERIVSRIEELLPLCSNLVQ